MRNFTIPAPLETGWISVPIDAVVPHHGPRDPQRVERLMKSMGEKGWYGYPMIGEIHAWNASHRLHVAKRLGFTHVPFLPIPGDWYEDHHVSLGADDSACRLEYARAAFGERSVIATALQIERGEYGGIESFYEKVGA